MNIKNISRIIITILLLVFSFYYTDKSIELIKQSDPIMKQIKENSKKYIIKAKNAKIKGNKITPGTMGIDIDYNKSYKKMKEYGIYNESLTVFKEVKPTVSIDDYYDKYILSGNKNNKLVSIVFPVKNDNNIDTILNILKEKNINATFFLDGLWLENNLKYIDLMTNYEIELLNYNNRYEEIYFSSSLNNIKNLTGEEPKYCYLEYDNEEVLNLCSRLKLHTIIPTIKIGNYPYSEIKKKLKSQEIVSIPINSITNTQLPVVIDYIKQKGYEFVKLNDLLSESIEK